ncbi:ABC transporter permease [Microbacterium sp. NIBRBAC000506063]|uniref:ABC transporter permease n=1 Tax=Microbacterium sp. NIBRBAC000506063 TaxID=2734618 RepID=UPI001BB4F561|nr:ABC transporter permease [Microbacterium sp. NIBRBAC000506063]QTV79589.1 ABC transporter permease [Microbacterium sp. NIBRBAC000506063]
MGIFQARRRNTVVDNALTAVTFVLYAAPPFFVAILVIELFAIQLGWFPAQASQTGSAFAVFTDPRAMVLPVLTLSTTYFVVFVRYQRSAALDQLGQDYIRVARAKGVSEGGIVRRHLLRNSSLPIITLLGLSVPGLLAGALIIETVFNYPGLGLLFINSLQREDYPVLLAYALIGGVLTVLGNLLADIAIGVADPRVTLR